MYPGPFTVAGNLTKTCLSSVLSFYVIWFISANQSSVKMQGSFICSELKYSLSKFQKLSKCLVARKANFLFLSLAFSLFLSLAFSLSLSAFYNLLLDITGAWGLWGAVLIFLRYFLISENDFFYIKNSNFLYQKTIFWYQKFEFLISEKTIYFLI